MHEAMMAEDVDAVMQTIPAEWRHRWCGGEHGPCACMGCVQVGNRLIMVGLKAHQVDPEYIDETRIPADIYARYKITRDEWLAWKAGAKS
jgi:hypothetical protein